ncbi:MAG: ester cyclase [Acidimicrobiales bacterium]
MRPKEQGRTEMSSTTEVARSVYEAWEKRDFDALVDHMTDDVIFNDFPSGQIIKGRPAVKDFYASWAAACPDSVCGANVIAASDDTVVIEGVWHGTNSGSFGPFPSTGRSVSMPWVNVLRFDADGRIASGAGYYDQLTVLTQLDHMKVPA